MLRPAMSGHSKWSTIKRAKGVTDAKRSALFTKVAREISVAARQGGGDPDANYRLRLAVEKARSVNMPSDNIKRTIDKAVGGGEAEQYEEIVYEGYGPGGVAVLVEAATGNRNPTAGEGRQGVPPRRAARGSGGRQRGHGQLRHPRGRLRRGRRVIILGIDPGTAALGYGVVERTGGRLRAIDHGCLVTSPDLPMPERL